MKKVRILIFSLISILFFNSCSNNNHESEVDNNTKYGGILRINELSSFKNLYPLNITETTSHRIAGQIYEGLVKLSQSDLSIKPALAKSWTVNENATLFTFTIRKNVFFHDNPCFENGKGRELTVNDVKFAFDNLCTFDANNSGFSFVQDRIKGAQAHYDATKNGKQPISGVEGVTVLNDSTIQIQLNYSFGGFLNIVSTPFCWVFPKEAKNKYGIDMRSNCVGTGPFIIKHISEGDVVVLEKNKNYWQKDSLGNRLPYLDGIQITFVKEKESEYLEFIKGNLDMLSGIPPQHVDEVLSTNNTNKDYEIQSIPSFSINYYGFLTTDKTFSNVKIRQAFNYAIDRKKIVEYTLKGTSYPANNGIVPPSFSNYPKVTGYNFDVKKAKQLLSEAGYPEGKNFPLTTLQLNSGGSVNSEIAEVVQKMLEENLGIKVKLNIMPWAEHLNAVETGNTNFFRSGWMADYPDPENFLTLLYGKLVPTNKDERSYQNSVRYKNSIFDELFEQALKEVDGKKRFLLYAKAEQIAMNDAPIIPLTYGKNIRLVKKNIHNFPINPLEYRDFTEVYIKR